MKIRKSRLKEIINEEVNNFKFISINERTSATSIREPHESKAEILRRVADILLRTAENADDPDTDRIPFSPTGTLSSIIGTLQQLIDDDAELHKQSMGLEEDATEPSRLLDEIIVQEIVKALEEAGEHERAAAALTRKSEKTPLGHNEKAALDYHRAQAEKEKENA